MWVQEQVYPEADTREVMHVFEEGEAYRLQLSDGSMIVAANIVIAIGLKPFAFKPPVFDNISSQLVFHTSDLHDPQDFRCKKVVIAILLTELKRKTDKAVPGYPELNHFMESTAARIYSLVL